MKSENPNISIIMSCFNSEKHVESSVESILKQTYEDFEFLIIDDFSTDDTFNILKKYEAKDKRIKVFKNSKNLGLTKSLNILIKKSKGLFIARQDADDTSKSDRLEYQIKFLQSTNFRCCTTRAKIKGSLKLIPKYSYIFPNNIVVKFKNPFIHGTLLIEKSLMNKIGGYDERFVYSQDYKLFSDLLSKKEKVKIIKKPLYILNMTGNLSSINSVEQKYYSDCVKRKINPISR